MDKDPRIVRLLTVGSFTTRIAGRGTFNLTFCPRCAYRLAESISDVDELDDAVYVIQHTSCEPCMEKIKTLLR